MPDKLKLCPFCGGNAAIRQRPAHVGRGIYTPKCTNKYCLASGEPFVTEREAAVFWNRRAGEEKNDEK